VELEQDYFKLLGIDRQYLLDEAALRAIKRRARDLQRQYHPDRLANASPREQQLAAQFSAQVNAASQVLKDPVARAMHMLEIAGVQFDQSRHTIRDTDFLMQQMQLREAVEEASAASDKPGLEALRADIEKLFADVQTQFAEHSSFGNQIVAPGQVDAVAQQQLLALVSKLQFFQKLEAEIEQALALA